MNTRRNPEMEKYTYIRPVITEEGEQYRICLKVDNQEFAIGQYPCVNTSEAEWMRDMLCIALAKIVKEAADEIERLRAALREIESDPTGISLCQVELARAALAEGEEGKTIL